MGLAQLFGANVRRLRQARGMSIEALADEVGLAYTYVGQIERGRRNPTLSVVERFAAVFGVDPRDMFDEGTGSGLTQFGQPESRAPSPPKKIRRLR
jgi:transcriptional regulator with XRE-family HTH domain